MCIYQAVRKDMIHVLNIVVCFMIWYMVICYMIRLTLFFYQKDVPEIDLLSEVSPYLTNRRDCIGEGGSSYVCGEYKGYKVYVNDKMLKINTCSLCKYYYGYQHARFPFRDSTGKA